MKRTARYIIYPIAALVLGVLLWICLPLGQWLQRWGEVLSGIGSLILSGFLVALYYRQQKILSLDHQPSIHISNYRGGVGGQEDMFELELSNTGKGAARGLVLQITPDFPDEEGFQGVSHELSLYPKGSIKDNRGRNLSSHLGANERNKWFEATPLSFLWTKPEWDKAELSQVGDASDPLISEEIDRVRLKIELHYKNSRGEAVSIPEPEIDIVIPITPSTDDMSTAIRRSLSYRQYKFFREQADEDPFSSDESPNDGSTNTGSSLSVNNELMTTTNIHDASNSNDENYDVVTVRSEEGRFDIPVNRNN